MKKSDYGGRSWAETEHRLGSSVKPCHVSRALKGLTPQVPAMFFCPPSSPGWPGVAVDVLCKAAQGSTRQH